MFAILYFSVTLCGVYGYELKQVFVLSRHSLRSPLQTNSELSAYTKKEWPEWDSEAGDLTAKGSLIERSMGKYFSDWLNAERLLSDNCTGEVFVYSNTLNRTVETAKSFASGFGDCASVYYKNTSEADPVFNADVKNTSKEFKDLVLHEIQKKLDKVDSLRSPLTDLEQILDFKNSSFCKGVEDCTLLNLKNELVLKLKSIPNLRGPLEIGLRVVDAFLMAYYDERQPTDIAWGEITTNEKWQHLMKPFITYLDVLFRTPILDKELAKALLEYMRKLFLTGGKKFYMLVGHDTNLALVMSSLNFKAYDLRDQLETTPIGGKVVFQKWYDAVEDQHLLRVEYVYQSTQQIIEGAALSLQNPPQRTPLEMKGCVVDANGFCLWIDFLNILNSL